MDLGKVLQLAVIARFLDSLSTCDAVGITSTIMVVELEAVLVTRRVGLVVSVCRVWMKQCGVFEACSCQFPVIMQIMPVLSPCQFWLVGLC